MIDEVSQEIASHYAYEDKRNRIRYAVFADELNQHYVQQGVKYIIYSQIVQFLVEVRGQCWIESGIGIASIHYQWYEQINKIFELANDFRMLQEERESTILTFLVSESKKAA